MAKIKVKRGIESNLGSVTLDDGELAITSDTHKLYVGFAGVKYCIGSTSSLGDMLKSIYDTTGNGIVDLAEKLSTARTISITGDMIGSTTFDGSANVTISTAIKTGLTWNDLMGG